MSNRTCLVLGCATDMSWQYLRKGYCERHYYSWRTHGDPTFIEDSKSGSRRARQRKRLPIEPCKHCGEDYEVKSNRAKYCSTFCRSWAVHMGPGASKYCDDCGSAMIASKGSRPDGGKCRECTQHGVGGFSRGCRCDVCVAAKREANMAYKAIVKAEHGVNPSTLYRRRYRERTGVRYRMAPSDWIDPKLRVEIYDRDGWVCHLCDEPVDRVADFNDDLAPSLDHLKPRSKGGSDDPDNLATAHRLCNSRRRDDELEALEVV